MELQQELSVVNLSKVELLRAVVVEKLTTAAQEIMAVVERTVASYEEEASSFREEVDRQKKQLELLLETRHIKTESSEDEFHEPQHEMVQGVNAGVETTPEDQQLKYEPSFEDNDIIRTVQYTGDSSFSEQAVPELTQSQSQAPLTEQTCEESSRNSISSKVEEPNHVVLKIRVLEDCESEVFSIRESRNYSEQKLKCPRHLPEKDFLELLRSMFPQLRADKPLELLKYNRKKNLRPLKLKSLTPLEIIKNVSIHSALYIRLRTNDVTKDSLPNLNQTGSSGHVELSIHLLNNSTNYDVLPPKVYDGCPVRILKCPTGLQESDFLELLRSVFPVLQADRPLEFFTANVRRKMFPLRLNTVTPEEILGHVKSRGSCALFLRSKPLEVEDVQSPPADLQLKVRVLEDSRISVLNTAVFRKYRSHTLKCPSGLQEPDFLDLLRSTFPQLAPDVSFDFYTSSRSKRLYPLEVNTLTPEEIQRAIRSTGFSSLYIRVKGPQQVGGHEDDLKVNVDAMKASPSISVINHVDQGGRSFSEEEPEGKGPLSHWSVQHRLKYWSETEDVDNEDVDEWTPERKVKTELKTSSGKRRVHSEGTVKKKKKIQPNSKDSPGPRSCVVCKIPRNSLSMLIKHSWTHMDHPARLCGVCGEHSESSEELGRHLHGHQKTHSCSICGKSFLSILGLRGHLDRHM
ncbi:uncharacterized protein LOC103389476 [Cynoglossus semilaevis]|uniref:uncharacterized protein LOC103389476 n=1 Tax=Cynoglossus semilaevis TaxID=244447 RepID=UPI000497D05A|nr:uncharacterized protein LOC103389476 [Cynoglossus semilaevis]